MMILCHAAIFADYYAAAIAAALLIRCFSLMLMIDYFHIFSAAAKIRHAFDAAIDYDAITLLFAITLRFFFHILRYADISPLLSPCCHAYAACLYVAAMSPHAAATLRWYAWCCHCRYAADAYIRCCHAMPCLLMLLDSALILLLIYAML